MVFPPSISSISQKLQEYESNLMLFYFQVFYTEMRNGRPLGTASLMEVPLSLDMLTTVSIHRVLIMLLYVTLNKW